MIGKVYLTYVDYYDAKTKTTRKKTRPVLVVGGPRNDDYTVLPISTISKRQNLDPDYDILVDAAERTALSLDKECFIRTHKQMPMHQAQLIKCLGDMRTDLPDLYLDAISRMEQFQVEIVNNAI